MGWLGVCYWICAKCHIIYLETTRPFVATALGWYS